MLNALLKPIGFEIKSHAAWEEKLRAHLGIEDTPIGGVVVTPTTAMKCTAVYAAVRVRCETLGSLPLMLYRRRQDGGKDRATDHPLYRLIHDRPNDWTSSADFVMQLEKDTMLYGAGYALANRSGDRIVELIRLAPSAVTVEVDEATLEPRYSVSLSGGTKRIYSWRDILHVPAMGGLSVITQAKRAIQICIAMEKHAKKLFEGGGRMIGTIEHPLTMSADAHKRMTASFNDQAINGRVSILEEGAKYNPITFNSVDLQFQELRAFQVIEIARATGVPPTLLQDFGRATWSNAEEMSQAFLTYTLMPRMRIWSGAISRLLSREEQSELTPEFLADGIVRADIEKRYAAYATAIAARIINPNEARAKEDMPSYDGGDEFANPNIDLVAPRPQQERPKPRAVA